MIARLEQGEITFDGVVARGGVRRMPVGARGAVDGVEAAAHRHELDGPGGVRIGRAGAAVGADLPSLRRLRHERGYHKERKQDGHE